MLDLFLDIIGVFCLTFSGIYIWSRLVDKKINFRDWKFYIFTIILFILSIVNYNNFLKFTVMTLIMALFVKFVFNVDFKSSFITVFYTQTVNLILEFLFAMIAFFVIKIDFNVKSINVWVTLFADLFISITCVLIFKIKFFKYLHKISIRIVNKIKIKSLLLALLPILFVFNVYMEITYYRIDMFSVFILNNISIYVIVIIILVLAKKENDYVKIYDKYNTTLNSLKEYEEILDKYRVSNHENKNQLLTIRNMLSKTNKKAISYIDQVVNNKLKDDERVMFEVSIIPAGGIRGLVYSKILYMKQNNIEYELNISKEVKTVDLISKLDDHDILDICQIIGVYIDNAIQAVSSLQEKYINIEMYLDNNNLVFGISNYYSGQIDLDKLEQRGYTTKGSKHGYGLSLSREIIDKNKKLTNEKRITNEIFTQILKIKM